jgi:hypothetical protein
MKCFIHLFMGVKVGKLGRSISEIRHRHGKISEEGFSNESYFQEEPPRRLVEVDEIHPGAYFEGRVEDMSHRTTYPTVHPEKPWSPLNARQDSQESESL